MKKILLLNTSEYENYKNNNLDNDILYLNENDIKMIFYYGNDEYDVYVILHDNEESKKQSTNYIIEKCTQDNIEFVIYNNQEDVVYDNENIYYLLGVVTGEYEDAYEKKIGLFTTRNKAIEYYKKHCELTLDKIGEMNRTYFEYEKNEPEYDSYKNDEEYQKAYAEYWNDKKCDYISEDEATSMNIKKLKIIS